MAQDVQEDEKAPSKGSDAPVPPQSWQPGRVDGQEVEGGEKPHDADSAADGGTPADNTRVDANPWQNGAGQMPPVPTKQALPQIPAQLASARKYVTAAQVCALVSLFIGGVLLSGVSVVLAIIAYRKLTDYALSATTDVVHRKLLVRPGIIAIIMGLLALALNFITLIALFPIAEQIMQTGDYSSLFGGSAGTGLSGAGSGGTSTWG